MPKRTREQKIIADLRRELERREGARPAPVKATEKIEPIKSEAAPIQIISSNPDEKSSFDSSYLKRDLIKVVALFGIVIAFEGFASYLVNTGALKGFGIT